MDTETLQRITEAIKSEIPGAAVWLSGMACGGVSIKIRTHKKCMVCKQLLPLSPEYFSRRKTSPDGFGYWCNACMSAHKKSIYKPTGRPRGRPRKTRKW